MIYPRDFRFVPLTDCADGSSSRHKNVQIVEIRRGQNSASSKAGLDPERSFGFVDEKVGYGMGKQSLRSQRLCSFSERIKPIWFVIAAGYNPVSGKFP